MEDLVTDGVGGVLEFTDLVLSVCRVGRCGEVFWLDPSDRQERHQGLLAPGEGAVLSSFDEVGDRHFARHDVVVAEVDEPGATTAQDVDRFQAGARLPPLGDLSYHRVGSRAGHLHLFKHSDHVGCRHRIVRSLRGAWRKLESVEQMLNDSRLVDLHVDRLRSVVARCVCDSSSYQRSLAKDFFYRLGIVIVQLVAEVSDLWWHLGCGRLTGAMRWMVHCQIESGVAVNRQ
ncbi:hypothetical protein PV772_06590 [Pseudarthrobacter sp. CC12]|uniref:hypothetical protein n=1 Tax=Pseudarthrobacter sp. CC12 TaxID=3029193 RepID=UPI0032637DAE